jgi:anti-sigma factor RsiW
MLFITHTRSRMRRLISVYLDGELDPTRTRRLMAHLEVCDRCRAELAAGRHLSSTIASAMHKGETPDILADVLVALNREKQRKSHGTARLFHRTFRPAFAYGAAALFGIAVGVIASSSLGTSMTATSDPLPVQYLSEAPPDSLITLYYGDTGEVADE